MPLITFARERTASENAALVLLLGFLWARSATGAPSRFALVQKECAALDAAALRELVALELRTLAVSDSAAHVEVTCSDGTAIVSLTDAQGRAYPIASRVDISRAEPGVRERLVALAATELVAQAERRAPPDGAGSDGAGSDGAGSDGAGSDGAGSDGAGSDGAPAAAKTARDVPAIHTPPPRRHRPGSDVELSLGPVVSVLGVPTTVLVGGAVTARFGLGGPWALAADARVERGTTHTELADVTWTHLGGSAAVLLEQRLGAVRVGVGAGARVTRVTLDPRVTPPNTGHVLSGVWGGPVVPLRAALVLAAPLVLVATAEAGYIAFPFRGTLDGGDRVVAATGPWASFGVGLGAAF